MIFQSVIRLTILSNQLNQGKFWFNNTCPINYSILTLLIFFSIFQRFLRIHLLFGMTVYKEFKYFLFFSSHEHLRSPCKKYYVVYTAVFQWFNLLLHLYKVFFLFVLFNTTIDTWIFSQALERDKYYLENAKFVWIWMQICQFQ